MSDFDILIEELDKISNKWAQRLSYQSNQGKDIHDSFLCSTVMYEIERASKLLIKELPKKDKRSLKSLERKIN
jgi:hypothetical protein